MGRGLRPVEGRVPFTVRVPWRLLLPEGRGGPAPLLVALHGMGDRIGRFEAEARAALPPGWALLLPSAPLPRDRERARPGEGSGASWYLYDGDTPRFRESLAGAEAHVLGLLGRLRRAAGRRPRGTRPPDFRRVALLGFSQGAYLAGVLAVRNPRAFRAAVLVSGRLKHETLAGEIPAAAAAGLRVLVLHGAGDLRVLPGPAAASAAAARAAGLAAEDRELPGGHEFTPAMRGAAREWLARLDGGIETGRAPRGTRPVRGARRGRPSG